MFSPATHMIPHQNYQAMHPIGYNPHFISQYPIGPFPGYPPNMANMNYITPSSNNGVSSNNNICQVSTSSSTQAYTDNKTNIYETKGDFY